MDLNKNQLQFMKMNGLLLGGSILLSCCAYPLFGGIITLALFAGGCLYLLAASFQGLAYFSFRGARHARAMLFTLKLGALVKFGIVITVYCFIALFFATPDLLFPLIVGTVGMHFAHAFGAAWLLR